MRERKQNSVHVSDEVIAYGIKHGVVLLASVLGTIVAGALLGVFGQSICFFFVLYFLRVYAGGYHAKTPFGCAIMSAVGILTGLICLRYLSQITVWMHLVLVVCGIVLWWVAPVDTINKQLSIPDRVYFGRRLKMNLGVAISVYVIALFFNNRVISSAIWVAVLFATLIVIIGLIDNVRGRNNENITM